MFRRQLSDDQAMQAAAWAGAEQGWSVQAEEQFAEGFEDYLREGKAPTPEMEGVFLRFAQWLDRLYRMIAPRWEISDDIRQVYDSLLTKPESGVQQGVQVLMQDHPGWSERTVEELRIIGRNRQTEAEARTLRTQAAEANAEDPRILFQTDINKAPELREDILAVKAGIEKLTQDIEQQREWQSEGLMGKTTDRDQTIDRLTETIDVLKNLTTKGVMFEDPQPGRYTIVHKSTRPEEAGSWRSSDFDERGATGHHVGKLVELVREEMVIMGRKPLKTAGDRLLVDYEQALLFQRDPHEESTRQAVRDGEAVPQDILQKYAGQEWADQELTHRAELAEDAQGFENPEEFAEFALTMDWDQNKPAEFYMQLWEQAQAQPTTRREGNQRFIQSLSKEALAGHLLSLTDQQLDALLPIVKAGVLRIRQEKKISEAHFKRMMDQVKADPAMYRDLFAQAGEDIEGLMALREEEIDPDTATIERLREERRQLKTKGESLSKTLGVLYDQVKGLDSRFDYALAELKRTTVESKAELKDISIEARSEARKGAAVVRAEERRKKSEAVKELRAKLIKARNDRDLAKKLIRRFMRKPSAAIRHQEKQEILRVQSLITTTGKARTIEARERLREMLKEDPELAKNEAMLNEANRRHVSELTLDELEQFADQVQTLRAAGRIERDQQLFEYYLEVEDAKGDMFNSLGGPPDQGGIGSKQWRKARKGKLGKRIQAYTLRPNRFAMMLDGDKQGTAYRELWREVNKAVDEELRQVDRRLEAGEARLKELAITPRDLARELETDGYTYTVDQVISMHLALMNIDSDQALMYGNKLSYDTIRKLVIQLDRRHVEWADWMLKDFGQENFDRIDEVLILDQNKSMEKVEAYFPIVRQDKHYERLNDETVRELVSRTGIRRSYPFKGFTKGRVKIKPEHQIAMRLGATGIWMEQVVKQEHYISHAMTVKKLHAIFRDHRLKEAIESALGQDFNEVIEKYINDVANPDIYKNFDAVSNLSRTLRQHAAMSYLGFNILTVFKQLPSIAFYMADAGPAQMLGSAGRFMANPREAIEFVYERDPQVKHRLMNRYQAELKRAGGNDYENAVLKIGGVGMRPIQWMDTTAVVIGWRAVYDRQIRQGASEQEAVAAAQDATLRTQPAGRAKDVAAIYRTNEGMNWFLMFTNQLNQIWNMATYDIPTNFKNGKILPGVMNMTAIAISALAIGAISRRRPAKDAEEIGADLLNQLASSVPVVGGSIKSGMQGWFGTGVDPAPVATQLGRTARKITSDAYTEEKLESLVDLLMEGMVTAGLPTVATKRAYRAFFEDPWFQDPQVELWELVGGRPEE